MTGSNLRRRSGASFAVAAPGQPFGSERALPHSNASDLRDQTTVVDLGAGHVAELILTQSGATRTARVALGRSSGAFAAPERVTGSITGDVSLAVAGSAHGDLLLAWISAVGRQRRVLASVRRAGERFGAPELLSSRADALQVNVAVGAWRHGRRFR